MHTMTLGFSETYWQQQHYHLNEQEVYPAGLRKRVQVSKTSDTRKSGEKRSLEIGA